MAVFTVLFNISDLTFESDITQRQSDQIPTNDQAS